MLGATAARAAEVPAVVAALGDQGFYLEPGAEEVDEDALREQFAAAPSGVRPVILARAPTDGEQAFAEQVLEQLGGNGTVLVISPDRIRMISTEASDGVVDEALAAAEDEVDFDTADAGEIALALAQAYSATAAAPGQDVAEQVRQRDLLAGALVAGGVAVAGVAGLGVRRRRRREHRSQQVVSEARTEVRRQIDVVGERIRGLSDRVALAGPEGAALLREADAAHEQAADDVEQAVSPQELELVCDGLDHARWQTEAVAAVLEGRPITRPDREPACLYDPTHGAGVETVTLGGAYGRSVHACADCAARLRAGQAPLPRMIRVGGRQVPAPMAPRAYGGGGLDDLPEIEVVVDRGQSPSRAT